ncbi:HAD superfamily hydrolase (TIGR01490 family) [Clostridium acetobutylicum]|uniref:Phosphoserine phosphatase family enzyme n=1 Tax=Clostridium acetobutylicum (strain ATCC 824 / DSM 792 / JCM 1419 / IAM 19013 / LMG 5710 / NBRC 13948 / NRRL B-527 / VKM B-1787 / 2291 / W) TaxID=272562 RepID=Q97GY8_CLOAB|nr:MULTISPECIES: HAD-IB family hydrolase [Clostridium]AAK80184.1 Phosphoserine phosphatase family enzyme [Clostridium acetobutylicum ATCC 824]AEI32241.1 phosphoserine phosphatase family protein [Clostridium acetobutylicum DSM 1731]AWV79391.1 HAD-IB family hydrolase [Clostridium acetobutylicum]KHD38370.1 HAD family hydrolase [Clostridium acetobutylicum]MBC2394638.1 HAD-IB family hydrolase [Clostridium acetobutylicum]
MKKLAIFDVDYTLTKKETLFEFYKFMISKNPKIIAKLPKILVAGILFFAKILDAGKAKEMFISFIDGIKEEDMKEYVKEFYDLKLSKILYVDAINTMKKLKSEGYDIFLISASAEFYLNELYNIKEVDRVIGTRFTNENGIFRRKIIGENCKGEEKVKRLKEVLEEEKIEVDFKESYMFSDSLSDMPLFKLVGHPYLVNPKKRDNNIEVLKWK